METAVLGGGCFWCLEAVFEQIRGVEAVVSGYCCGVTTHPTYAEVCEGNTCHAEVVSIRFDPARISFREVLQVFFAIHDPTSVNRQGNDIGTQYRSIIVCQSPDQERGAHRLIGELAEKKIWDSPIVTQVVAAQPFYPAEKYHQQYFRNNPGQGYCAFVVSPKVAKFRKEFAELLKPECL
ncbi:MAG: peptide methionine sulfoxide reductase [Rhodocyclaceae bacterium]|nr:peptide methionine sulfoxide reductase [Rhodocyclaceae bacterium]